jgi:hypothetical protein
LLFDGVCIWGAICNWEPIGIWRTYVCWQANYFNASYHFWKRSIPSFVCLLLPAYLSITDPLLVPWRLRRGRSVHILRNSQHRCACASAMRIQSMWCCTKSSCACVSFTRGRFSALALQICFRAGELSISSDPQLTPWGNSRFSAIVLQCRFANVIHERSGWTVPAVTESGRQSRALSEIRTA